MYQLLEVPVAVRPFGTAREILHRKLTVHTEVTQNTQTAELTLPAILDEFEMLRNEVKDGFVSLSKSMTIKLGFHLTRAREMYTLGLDALNAWKQLPVMFLAQTLYVAQKLVSPFYEEIRETTDVLFRNVAPIALKHAVLTAKDLDSVSEAYSHHSNSAIEAIRYWDPEKSLALQFFVEKHILRRLSEARAELKGIDSKLSYRFQMIWHARSVLEAFGLERWQHTPELITQEVVRYVEEQGRPAKSWTVDAVKKLLEIEQLSDSALSLDAPVGEDATASLGDFLLSDHSMESQLERMTLEDAASAAIERLKAINLYDQACLLDLHSLIASVEAGHEGLVDFSMTWNISVDAIRDIYREVHHLSQFS